MRCTYLHLRGFNRFDTGMIRELVIRPDNPVQLILGSNGSGKSSLLPLLYPTVPERADFDKDGYYEYRCEHRNKQYRLISRLEKGFKHEFYVNDSDNLNGGGTQPAQWKLIEEHFELNDDTIRLLLGYETAYQFTEMGPMKRRERLTQICPVNVDYALELFQVVKQQVRSLKAVNEHTLNKLVETSQRIEAKYTGTDHQGLEAELKQQRSALEAMMGLPLFDSDVDQRQLLESAQRAHHFNRELLHAVVRYQGGTSQQEQQNLAELREQLANANAKLESQVDELLGIDNILDQLKQSGEGDIDQIKARLARLDEQLQQDHPGELLTMNLDAVVCLQQLTQVQAPLTELLQEWIDTDNTYHVYDAEAYIKEEEVARMRLRNAKHALADLEAHLDHLNHQPQTSCPKCNYRFHVGETEKTGKASIEQRIQKGHAWVEEQEKSLAELSEKVQRYTLWMEQHRQLTRWTKDYYAIKPMWDNLLEEGRKNGLGFRSIGIINDWLLAFEKLARYTQAEQERKHLQGMLERVQAVDVEPLQQRRELLYKNRTELLTTVERLTQAITATEGRLETITAIMEDQVRSDNSDKALTQLWLEYLQHLYTKSLRAAMSDTVRRISHVEQQLQEAKTDQQLLAQLETTQKEVEEQLGYAQLVLDELSPSNGLIAETIAGPINAFVEYMNGIIASIWEYQLQILPCAIDAQGLNYRFPLLTEKYPTPRKDIVYGSKGQKEIINIAFIIAMMHYKGFTDYPLMLDEFASTFDPQHQSNAMDFVRRLVDGHRVSQVWFISHYVINHASFRKAECMVLDKTNIILPETYNEHVTII